MFNANRSMIFVDGENLIQRYQDSLKAGATPSAGVCHIDNALLWHPKLTTQMRDIKRISYYTTYTGDAIAIKTLIAQIADTTYGFLEGLEHPPSQMGRLVPHVFTKERKSAKTKSVDINLTIDALRHTYNDTLDTAYICSGDGDYLPLITEIMRQGKRVIVWAFSSGLNPQLPSAADGFANLDKYFFRT